MTMGEDSSSLYEWLIDSVHRMELTESDSVTQWLEDLRLMTETECMCVLQGKSLSQDTTDVVFTASKCAKDSIDSIKGRAHVISAEFSKLFRKLEKDRWKHVKSGALRVTCQIRSLLHECNSTIPNPDPHFSDLQQQVMGECTKLAHFVESNLSEVNGHSPHKMSLVQQLTLLGQSFSTLVDLTLSHFVRKLTSSLNNDLSVYSVRSTINNLVSLGLEGEHMCYLISREGGVAALFSTCQRADLEPVHGQALRAIATICCVSESIIELEKADGVSCLSDILSDGVVAESVRSEAAGVLAQITSPCLDYYHHLAGFIENMDDIVKALTVLCSESSNTEIFLLGAAALANITFMDSMTCDYLLQYHTARVLVHACALNKADSLFAKDQVVTVLANMAAVEACFPDITTNSGLDLLVTFLYEPRPKYGTEAEMAACERVQQKAAIALTRLTRETGNAHKLVQLNAIPRLVQLCRDPKERNYSDAVLVACLAAVRKITGICGLVDYENEQLQQLVQPKLMDSYNMCTTPVPAEESFV